MDTNILSNTLSLRKFYQEDFDDNSIILFHMSGLSYETIVLIKIIAGSKYSKDRQRLKIWDAGGPWWPK